jgi:hypothetical protein
MVSAEECPTQILYGFDLNAARRKKSACSELENQRDAVAAGRTIRALA